jgi:hypothetical protein
MHIHIQQEKNEHIISGNFNVISCCVLWVFSREETEHIVEPSGQKTYIKSLITDLKGDSTLANYIYMLFLIKKTGENLLAFLENEYK